MQTKIKYIKYSTFHLIAPIHFAHDMVLWRSNGRNLKTTIIDWLEHKR